MYFTKGDEDCEIMGKITINVTFSVSRVEAELI